MTESTNSFLTLDRRSLLRAAAAAPLAMPFVARAAEKKSLIIAEPLHSTGYLPLYIAVQKGFFDAENLDVRVVTMDSSGSAHTNAVLSGQAFAFIGGPEHCAFAKAKGAELRAVANVVNRGNVYFMAKPDLKPGADLAAFLKGRAIASGFFGGTPNSITRYVILKSGLALSDVRIVESTAAGDLAAVRAGQAEIGVGTEPVVTQGIREGLWAEPFYNVPRELGEYAYSTLNVRQDSIEKDPETVKGFVRGVMRGLKATYADRDDATRIAQAMFPTMPPADLAATMARSYADELWSPDGMISKQSWTTAKSVVMAAGILKQDVPYEAIIDMQFMSGAMPA